MTNIPFTPLFARVVLRREKVNKIGSILLPDSTADKHTPEEGILIAAGHTCEPEVSNLIGKKVIFAKYSGSWIKVGDDEYFICQEEDLLGGVNE
jgi:chaperonin GroES